MGKAETTIQSAIREDLGLVPGLAVWRNQVGLARYCTRWRECREGIICPACGHRQERGDLRLVPYGLAVGSADLIGVAPGGRFLSIEVKTLAGRLRREQRDWAECMRSLGVLHGVARSVDDARRIVGV